MKLTITNPMIQAYADASGDRNPIHLDESAAKAAGLPGVIAHGMLTAALLEQKGWAGLREQVSDQAKRYTLKNFQVRFRAMTSKNDVIQLECAPKSRPKNASSNDIIEFDLRAVNQKNEVTTTAVAEFQLSVG